MLNEANRWSRRSGIWRVVVLKRSRASLACYAINFLAVSLMTFIPNKAFKRTREDTLRLTRRLAE